MNILVDSNIRGAGETFGRHGTLSVMDGREISRRDLSQTDVLLIRTATRVDAELLEGSPVRFVGTTSIGTDHMDTGWLERKGIVWANAPGCNADSAAQYTLAMAWLACERLGLKLEQCSVGIIGHGNVGSRVDRLLRAVGAETIANDPPLEQAGRKDLVSLEEALACDIICLHVPLTRSAPYPTWRLINRETLERVADGALLINTARGDVVHGPALLDALRSGRLHAALDTWPGEPSLEPELLDRAVVATPHVAGYSDDGKRRGTQMVYEAFCRWAGLGTPTSVGPGHARPELQLGTDGSAVAKALEAACFVARHDQALRALKDCPSNEIARGFDRLRRDYPPRRDFHAWLLHGVHGAEADVLSRLGFSVNDGFPVAFRPQTG